MFEKVAYSLYKDWIFAESCDPFKCTLIHSVYKSLSFKKKGCKLSPSRKYKKAFQMLTQYLPWSHKPPNNCHHYKIFFVRSSTSLTFISGLTDWCKRTSFSQCQTDTEADLINHFDHSCSVLNFGPISVKSIFGSQTICVKVLSWMRLYQQIVKSSSDSPVASRALCFLCRSVSLSDLIPLMLFSFNSLQKPKATALDTPLSLEWLVSQPCW